MADPTLFAAKQLNAVEVDPGTSNQHEFHAGLLRRSLGFESRTEGPINFIFYSDGVEPLVRESRYTVYDAREGTSRTEWRLYYQGDAISSFAKAGDLLVICRPSDSSTDLHAIVAQQGTRAEQLIRAAFEIRDRQQLNRFARVDPSEPDESVAQAVAAGLLGQTTVRDFARHPLLLRTLETRQLPTTAEMAEAARTIVKTDAPDGLGADEYLLSVLNAETALFEAIESALGQQQLNDLVREAAGFDGVMKFALSKLQSRKARRGASLELHVGSLLRAYSIPFSSQCETEKGERPDFIVPGCKQYHNAAYPANLLRMVGCKSKLRDRWRQHASEAERISIKHHVSLDDELSDAVILEMNARRLIVCMPKPIVEKAYAGRVVAKLILTIEELISELRSVTVGVEPEP